MGVGHLGKTILSEELARVSGAMHVYAPAGTSDIQLLRLVETAMGTSRGQWSERLADQVQVSYEAA